MKVLSTLLLSVAVVCSSSIGKKVPVPDSNQALQDLVYRSAVPNANNQIRDSTWWIPIKNEYHATKISVPNSGKTYTTYSFSYELGKSLCSSTQVPISGIKSCKLDSKSNKKVKCQTMLAWNENDWSSIEIENRCSR